MKIGIICHPSIGGSGLVATQLGIGLATKGHEIHFVSRAMPFKLSGIEKSDVVTTVSEYQKQHTLDQFQLHKPIEVIYNFIDPHVFNPQRASAEVRQSLAADDEKLIMHISNFRQPKNTSGVVKSFAKTVGKINARLVLIGNGPDMAATKILCLNLGIIDKVTFLGKRKHLESIIPNADCVLQPSYIDSFGMVSLEAMASGVPAVTSNRDGIPEVVSHGVTGFITDPDDHDALAAYLIDICNDSELQKKLGENGRARAMDCFLWDNQVEKYLNCYENCLDNTM